MPHPIASSPCRLSPWQVWGLALALATTSLLASAQQDPPGRVARLGAYEGTVSFAPAGDDSWYAATVNRPLTSGDRLWADRNARAEVQIGSAALRMDHETQIELTEIDDNTVRITAQQGSVQLRVRDDVAGQRVEIDTGNAAVVIDAPGDYRIDADPATGTTWLAIAAGQATLYGENGETQSLGARQQLRVGGRNLVAASGAPVSSTSAFDRWVAERNRVEDQSVAARFVSRDVVGYQQLDAYGDWQTDETYGNVWYPRNVDASWAPYSDGQWVNVAPWGWTWVDAAPWGFAPSHYGRWSRFGGRWGWVPGRTTARPVYSPALVGFVGNTQSRVPLGDGRQGVGWFPLGPGEAWRPGFQASQRYIDRANRTAVGVRIADGRRDGYLYQSQPGAVTVVPTDRFGRGPIERQDFRRFQDGRFNQLPVMPIPNIVPGRSAFGGLGQPLGRTPPPFGNRFAPFDASSGSRHGQDAQRQLQELQQRAAGAQQQQIQQQIRLQQEQQAAQARAQGQAVQAQQVQLQQFQQQQMQQQQQLAAQAAAQREAVQRAQEQQQRAALAQQQQQQQMQQLQLQAVQQQQVQQQRAAQGQLQAQVQAQQQQIQQAQQMQQRQFQAQAQANAQAQQNALRQMQEAQARAMRQPAPGQVPGGEPPKRREVQRQGEQTLSIFDRP